MIMWRNQQRLRNTFKPRPLFPCPTSARSTASPCTWRGRPAPSQSTWRLAFWAQPTWRRRGAWSTFQRWRTWQWAPGWRMRSSPGSSPPACPPSSWFSSSWRTAATRTNSSNAFSMFLLQKLRCVTFREPSPKTDFEQISPNLKFTDL